VNLNELAVDIHQTAVDKGWWNQDNPFSQQVANYHGEASEAWEEYRAGHAMTEIYYKDGKPEGIPIELADIIIRVLDTCDASGIDIEAALREKMKYNETRPYRHGDKLA
jgi:NTP pyrophosphatase (non-canonical NTP hydrolase)